MEFEPATLHGRPPIAMAPIEYKYRQKGTPKIMITSNSNSNSDRDAYGGPDSSMENSLDSLDMAGANESLHLVKLHDAKQPSIIGVKGKEKFQPGVALENRQKRHTTGADVEANLLSPLLATLKSSSRHSHIPPLAPSLKVEDTEQGGGGIQPENKGTVLTGHSGAVNHIANLNRKNDLVSTPSKFVVSGGSDSTVRLWNLEEGRCVGRCVDPMQTTTNANSTDKGSEMSAVTALATASNNESGYSIVTGTENGYVRVWELGRSEGGDARLQSKFNAHAGRVTCLISESSSSHGEGGEGGALINSYPRLVSGGADRTVRLWDPRLRKPQVFLFKGHTDTVNALLLDASRACVVSGGRDQSVRIWDIRTGRQRSSMMEHFGSVNCLGISKDKSSGGSYMSSGRDGVICLWKRGSGEFTRSLRQGPNAKAVTCLGVKQGEGSDGGSRSISGSADGTIRVWDHNRGKCLKTLAGHSGAVTSAVWSGGLGAGCVVSGGTDGQVRLWDARGGRCLQWIQAHASSVTKVICDSRFIFSSSRDGSLRVWEVAQNN